MKKFIIALFICVSISVGAQESVLLRVNYTKGDQYEMKMEQNQNLGPMGTMNMSLMYQMMVSGQEGANFKLQSKIAKIVFTQSQGEMTVSYDSSSKSDSLDQMGVMLKNQFEPMLKVAISSKVTPLGAVQDIVIDPALPGMEQLTKQVGDFLYPEEKVSVGSTWSVTNENQGMKIVSTYKVAKIEDDTVFLDIVGVLSGAGEGTLKGSVQIDAKTGIQQSSSQQITISVQGMEVTNTTTTTITKM